MLIIFATLPFPTEWLRRFAINFFPAFIASGLLYGIIYVLFMRAIRVNRGQIEAWFEGQRQRLLSGPVPVIETIHPVILSALCAIYGRTVLRRFLASFYIASIFSGIVLGVLYYEYRHLPVGMHQTKRDLERELDPFLYKYATTSELASDYKRAFEQTKMMVPSGETNAYISIPKYTDEVSERIRSGYFSYNFRFLAAVSADPHRVALTLLYLFEGHFISPGFRCLDSIMLFVFNVLVDFASITIVLSALLWLRRDPSMRRATPSFLLSGVGTAICCLISFVSYSMFLRGNTSFFAELLFGLPLSLAFVFAAICLLGWAVYQLATNISWIVKERDFWVVSASLYPAFLLVCFVFILWAIGIAGIREISKDWQTGVLAGIPWRNLFQIPYVLALTPFIPAILALFAFSLMMIAKVTAEPTRVVPEAYMTFIKEEVGGTQASGIIAILGLITGVVVGLIGASR